MPIEGVPAVRAYGRYTTAFFAGIAGGAVMTILMAIARAMNLTQMNLEMMLGTMVGARPSPGTWFFGLIWHLLNSGLIALIYAAVFRRLGRANAKLGTGFAVIHWAMAGLFMGMVPLMHPMIPEQMPAPGFFAVNGGAFDFTADLMLHLIYGAIVGGIYGASARKAHVRPEELATRKAA